jgi:hypothetical protein
MEMKIGTFRAVLAAFLAAAIMAMSAAGPAEAQSVMRQCGDEWKAAKANNTTNGQTWQEFLKDCRTRHAAAPAAPAAAAPAAPAAATPAAAPAPAPAPAAAPAPAPTQAALPKPSVARPTGAGEFTTATEAQAHCPSDKVVWVNTKSKIYHYEGTRSYGSTKRGAYMCEGDAVAAGDRASKSRIGQKAQAQPQ